MSRSKHSEAEMVGAIRQMDAGRKAEDVARDVHREALTTRLLFLFSLARKTRIGNQNFLTLQSMHAKAGKVAHLLGKISGWFENFKAIAKQLRLEQRWHVMLRWIFQYFTAERATAVFRINVIDTLRGHQLLLSHLKSPICTMFEPLGCISLVQTSAMRIAGSSSMGIGVRQWLNERLNNTKLAAEMRMIGSQARCRC